LLLALEYRNAATLTSDAQARVQLALHHKGAPRRRELVGPVGV